MVTKDSYQDHVHFGAMNISSLLMQSLQCISAVGSIAASPSPSDPAHEVSLVVLVELLCNDPAAFRDALRTAAETNLAIIARNTAVAPGSPSWRSGHPTASRF